jgi:uncharacterized membrane protein
VNRIRVGCAVTVLLGTIYAFAGLLESLGQFAIGVIVAMIALILYGLLDFLEAHRNEQLHRERIHVWERRDQCDQK